MYNISGSTHQRLGASLAEEMDAEFCGVVNRHFPDGERYIRILMDVHEQDVVVVQNTFPDKKIVELLLILQAVKEAGAKSITCVIPYILGALLNLYVTIFYKLEVGSSCNAH